MLRVLLLTALYLMAGFAALIGLFARAWGWSEYASDELYVVYFQQRPAPPYPFFMVSTNGSDQQWQLTWAIDTLTRLDCSPDGRTLAFLTAAGHLYVINQAGLLNDRLLDKTYTALSVANNGMVALFKSGALNAGEGALLINSNQVSPLIPPDAGSYAFVEPSSPGTVLWYHTNNLILQVTSPTGEMIASFPLVIAPKWLGSEQLITFADIASIPAQRVLIDMTAQKMIRLSSNVVDGVFSPDGTQRAINRIERGTSNIQIVIADSLTNDHAHQLTHDTGVIYAPVCFLSFRPQMLIAGR